jgi:hypothetical protein
MTKKASLPVWKQLTIVTISLCIGGLIGALLVATPFGLVGVLAGGTIRPLITFGGLTAIFTVPAALVFGLPAFFLLKRFRILNMFSVSLIGAIAGVLVPLAMFQRVNFPGIHWWWNLAGIGSASAIVAFLVLLGLGITESPSNTTAEKKRE